MLIYHNLNLPEANNNKHALEIDMYGREECMFCERVDVMHGYIVTHITSLCSNINLKMGTNKTKNLSSRKRQREYKIKSIFFFCFVLFLSAVFVDF